MPSDHPDAPGGERAEALGVTSRGGSLRGGQATNAGIGIVLLVAVVVTLGSIGRQVMLHPGGGTVGLGPDVQIFLWGLRWWPFALSHGIDPANSHQLWPPYGVSVLWTTTVPALSLVITPVTLLFGAATAWNLLCIAAPVISAGAAYLLCAELTERFWPSLTGGLLFGFSSYEISQERAHLQLTMAAVVPLCALTLVRHTRGKMGTRRFVCAIAALVVLQALIAMEVLATTLLMGAVLAIASYAMLPHCRERVRATAGWALAGVAIAAVVIAPLVIEMLATNPQHVLNPAASYSADLLNFVVPTRIDAVGGGLAASVSDRFVGNLAEQSAYLGLPAVLIVVAFAVTRGMSTARPLLMLMLIIAAVLSLGPTLHIDGQASVTLPGALLTHVPLLDDALPGRLAVYVALDAALIVAVWLSRSRLPRTVRAGVGTLACLALVPALAAHAWWQPTPSAIVRGGLGRAIPAGATAISLPFWAVDDRGLYAQAATGFRFRLIDQWVQDTPTRDEYLTRDPALQQTAGHPTITVREAPRLTRALCSHGVHYAIVWNPGNSRRAFFAAVARNPRAIGNALVYRVPCAPVTRSRR